MNCRDDSKTIEVCETLWKRLKDENLRVKNEKTEVDVVM